MRWWIRDNCSLKILFSISRVKCEIASIIRIVELSICIIVLLWRYLTNLYISYDLIFNFLIDFCIFVIILFCSIWLIKIFNDSRFVRLEINDDLCNINIFFFFYFFVLKTICWNFVECFCRIFTIWSKFDLIFFFVHVKLFFKFSRIDIFVDDDEKAKKWLIVEFDLEIFLKNMNEKTKNLIVFSTNSNSKLKSFWFKCVFVSNQTKSFRKLLMNEKIAIDDKSEKNEIKKIDRKNDNENKKKLFIEIALKMLKKSTISCWIKSNVELCSHFTTMSIWFCAFSLMMITKNN